MRAKLQRFAFETQAVTTRDIMSEPLFTQPSTFSVQQKAAGLSANPAALRFRFDFA